MPEAMPLWGLKQDTSFAPKHRSKRLKTVCKDLQRSLLQAKGAWITRENEITKNEPKWERISDGFSDGTGFSGEIAAKHMKNRFKETSAVQMVSAPEDQSFGSGEEKDIFSLHGARLQRRDLILHEKKLVQSLSLFFVWASHSILFPKHWHDEKALWIAEEGKLLLPIIDQDQNILGVFYARGVEDSDCSRLVARWPVLAQLVSDNLLLYKQSLCDPLTGLYSRHYFQQRMAAGIETLREAGVLERCLPGVRAEYVKESVRGETAGFGPGNAHLLHPGYGGSCGASGVIVTRFSSIRNVVREFGYEFADSLLRELADALQAICPEQACAARTGDMEFSVYLPAATSNLCQRLAEEIALKLHSIFLEHPLRKNRVGVSIGAGYALYPQHTDLGAAFRSVYDQAAVLLRQARLAAALAKEQTPEMIALGEKPQVMGFGQILQQGGRIMEVLPHARVITSLGAHVRAREGMRFSIWSAADEVSARQEENTLRHLLYKGEVVLIEVQDNASLAEIIYAGTPGSQIAPNDLLRFLPDPPYQEQQKFEQASAGGEADGLLRHGDFLTSWIEKRETCTKFCLSLLRVDYKQDSAAALDEGSVRELGCERMQEIQAVCQERIPHSLAGRYGAACLIFFHPDQGIKHLEACWTETLRILQTRLFLEVSVGIAEHPFLEFRKGDCLENVQKALEYALLLPDPRVGSIDSLALNISADKLFSQGELFGAIKEYKNALLADEMNAMAWNSLGICLASVGRHDEAEEHFLQALQKAPDDAKALYNLAYIKQSRGSLTTAKQLYQDCLEIEPKNLYALVRLGQIAETEGHFAEARRRFEQAVVLPGGKNLTYRHFARLCLTEGKAQEAREYLHKALLADPQDALAMQLLAQLYLDGGEDPEMAAVFARQSVSLIPGLKGGWLVLARALEASGDLSQAKAALLRAGEL